MLFRSRKHILGAFLGGISSPRACGVSGEKYGETHGNRMGLFLGGIFDTYN